MNWIKWYMFVFLYFPIFVYFEQVICLYMIEMEIENDKRYQVVKEKKSIIKKIKGYIVGHLYLLIVSIVPIMNIILFFNTPYSLSKITKSTIESMLKKGTLIEKGQTD